jgi:enterobactin synthetase component F
LPVSLAESRPGSTAAPHAAPAPLRAPLTEAQEGLWFAQVIDPGNPIFNTGEYLEIRGPLDVDAFRAAVDQVMAEADALSIRVEEGEDGPVQVVDAAVRPRLEVLDLSTLADPAAAVQQRMHLDMATPLDPTRDPLVAQRLFVLAPGHFVWYQRLHHLVIDAYAMSLLNTRVADLYTERLSGRPAGSVAFTPYARVIEQDGEYRQSTRREDSLRFWREQFAGGPEVIGLAPGAAVTGRTAISTETDLARATLGALHELATRARVPWPDVLVAIVSAYVIRLTGGREAVVGVPSMERIGTAAARVPCMWMNVLPIRLTLDEDVPVTEFVQQASKQLKSCRRHGRYRSEQLRRDLGLLSRQRRLYGVLINVLPFQTTPALPDVQVTRFPLGNGPVDDLTVTLRAEAGGEGMRLELDANPNLYSPERLQQHVARLAAFIDAAVASERLGDVPTLTADEHHHWVEGVNQTVHPVEDTTLTALIERTLREHASGTAVVFEESSITYAELDRRSAALARRLAAAGAGRGTIVAIALPRSMEMMVTLVAILRTGAAYLPIDASQPLDRNLRMLRAAGPIALVALESASALAETLPLLRPHGEDPGGVPLEAPSPEDAAYVIFTSGSTGEPKGAVIQHRAIVNRLEWMRQHYEFGAGDRFLQKTPVTFDVSVWELFLPFLAGATLVVAPPDAHKDPEWLARLIERHAITTLHFVPSMLALFLAEPRARGLRVRRVFCSGEALPAALRDRFHETMDAALHNLYGPTEAAVDVTWWDASKGDTSSPVPIGFPVWNTRMYVLDRRLRPLPAGVPGDLFIAGVQLAREYLNRPDLTPERFVPDPFVAGARMYRTGDVAQWRDDGALEYLGRSDHQIKIRGNRVELGEIEAALVSLDAVDQAAVIARTDPAGDMQLVAYLVPPGGRTPDPESLRGDLRRLLPDYMVPASFVTLPVLPLTRSGKLDRASLPAPAFERRAAGRAPASETERRLTALFAETLGLPDEGVSADDDFFSIGGHSLGAARVMMRVREAWGADFGLGTLFTYPTPAALALVVDAWDRAERHGRTQAPDQGLGPVVRLVDGSSGIPPLFCVHPAGGIAWCYGGLARALSPGRGVYGLQARGLDPEYAMPERLDEMAADYVDSLKSVQASGPYHLAGWSFGGIVAQAMAVRLQSLGDTVATLALLDAYPSDCWRARPEPQEGAALRALLLIAGQNPDTVEGALTRESVVARLRAIGHPLGTLPDTSLAGIVRVVERNNALVRAHYHRPFRGRALFFRASLDHTIDGLDPHAWQPYVGGLDVHDVPFVHAHLTGAAAVAQIAPQLAARLREGDRRS